ncbi:expressed unknown protein [Seminavis robusta]|uniref:Uncharacterized protein n=1 Tax=Seminavis robusta TaxID=568900 RepID=A0A9N8EH44_9STRA|nr:expressed unknown protein [Seminavis robusta]|eukprot:Sro1088_g239950.1 n/a (436) ;mRNA; r:8921-10228
MASHHRVNAELAKQLEAEDPDLLAFYEAHAPKIHRIQEAQARLTVDKGNNARQSSSKKRKLSVISADYSSSSPATTTIDLTHGLLIPDEIWEQMLSFYPKLDKDQSRCSGPQKIEMVFDFIITLLISRKEHKKRRHELKQKIDKLDKYALQLIQVVQRREAATQLWPVIRRALSRHVFNNPNRLSNLSLFTFRNVCQAVSKQWKKRWNMNDGSRCRQTIDAVFSSNRPTWIDGVDATDVKDVIVEALNPFVDWIRFEDLHKTLIFAADVRSPANVAVHENPSGAAVVYTIRSVNDLAGSTEWGQMLISDFVQAYEDGFPHADKKDPVDAESAPSPLKSYLKVGTRPKSLQKDLDGNPRSVLMELLAASAVASPGPHQRGPALPQLTNEDDADDSISTSRLNSQASHSEPKPKVGSRVTGLIRQWTGKNPSSGNMD